MKKAWLLCGVIVLVIAAISCRHVPYQERDEWPQMHGRNPADSTAGYKYRLSQDFPERERLTFDKFVTYARNGKIGDTLEALSKDYENYLKFYALVYKTGSAQGADFLQPRAIVFGPQAEFVFTFNGHSSQVGGNAVETLSLNKEKQQWELREIVFKNERVGDSHLSGAYDEIDFQTDQIIVSKPNPPSCMECHGLRVTGPIWQSYAFWPGAYGSSDDLMFDAADSPHSMIHGGYLYLDKLPFPRSQGRYINLKNGVADVEATQYLAFLSQEKEHGRYQWLPARPVIRDFSKEYLQLELAAPNKMLSDRLAEINSDLLVARLKALGLKEKWADIRWPCYDTNANGCKHDDSYQGIPAPLTETIRIFSESIGPTRLKKLSRDVGNFGAFFKRALIDEFAFQVYRINEFEKTFGQHSFERTKGADDDKRRRIYGPYPVSDADYRKLLKATWDDRHEIMLRTEADDVTRNALLAYLLRGEGVYLEDYAINRQRAKGRVLDFSARGLRGANEYLFSH